MFPLIQTAAAIIGAGFLFVTGVVLVDNAVNEEVTPPAEESLIQLNEQTTTSTDMQTNEFIEQTVVATSSEISTTSQTSIVGPASPSDDQIVIEPVELLPEAVETPELPQEIVTIEPVLNIEDIREEVVEVESYSRPLTREDCLESSDPIECLSELRTIRGR